MEEFMEPADINWETPFPSFENEFGEELYSDFW